MAGYVVRKLWSGVQLVWKESHLFQSTKRFRAERTRFRLLVAAFFLCARPKTFLGTIEEHWIRAPFKRTRFFFFFFLPPSARKGFILVVDWKVSGKVRAERPTTLNVAFCDFWFLGSWCCAMLFCPRELNERRGAYSDINARRKWNNSWRKSYGSRICMRVWTVKVRTIRLRSR